jgi:hypothetical protein
MLILFLHGWQSTPGSLKPTYFGDYGHEVFNPALPNDDFDQAVRIAQAEFDWHRPGCGRGEWPAPLRNGTPTGYTFSNGRRPVGNRKPGGVDPSNHYGKRTNGRRYYQEVDKQEFWVHQDGD